MAKGKPEALGLVLRRAREAKDVSLREVAEHANLHTWQVWDLEMGRTASTPDPMTMLLIGLYLDSIQVLSYVTAACREKISHYVRIQTEAQNCIDQLRAKEAKNAVKRSSDVGKHDRSA